MRLEGHHCQVDCLTGHLAVPPLQLFIEFLGLHCKKVSDQLAIITSFYNLPLHVSTFEDFRPDPVVKCHSQATVNDEQNDFSSPSRVSQQFNKLWMIYLTPGMIYLTSGTARVCC